jgi:hypothetical protein
VTFTSGWNTYMKDAAPTDYFTSDDSTYTVKKDGDELQLVIDSAAAVRKLIDAIPEYPATTDGRAAVQAARDAYDDLTDDEKDEIKASQLKKLTDAEAAIKQADLASSKDTAKTALAKCPYHKV